MNVEPRVASEVQQIEQEVSIVNSTVVFGVLSKLTAAVSDSFARVEKYKRRRSRSCSGDGLAAEKRSKTVQGN